MIITRYYRSSGQLVKRFHRLASNLLLGGLIAPVALAGQEAREVAIYTAEGVQQRAIGQPTTVTVGLPTPVEVPSAVTGNGQGRRLMDVEIVASEGVGGRSSPGLPGRAVAAITEDAEGNVWVGTQAGLGRFNGLAWTTFTEEDGLSHNSVRDLEVDHQGHLWAAGEGYPMRFDGQRWHEYRSFQGGPDLAVAPDGDMWFAGWDAIYRFDGQDWWVYGYEDGIPDGGQVFAITVDGSGTIWAQVMVLTYEFTGVPDKYYVASFDGQQWTSYEISSWIRTVFTDSKSRVWVGTKRGLYVREGVEWHVYERAGTRWMFWEIAEDAVGRLWMAGDEVGVFDGTRWTFLSGETFQVHEGIFVDSRGDLWFGGFYNGELIRWAHDDLPTSIGWYTDPSEPGSFQLFQNWPNPFNQQTEIAFRLGRRQAASLAVFSSVGQRVATWTDATYPAGRHQTSWDGRDDDGQPVASGTYVFRVAAGTRQLTHKMALVR